MKLCIICIGRRKTKIKELCVKINYLAQTNFGLFLKGVGKTSENIVRGTFLRMKLSFSGSIGNDSNFCSGENDHSVIFFFNCGNVVMVL